MRLVNIALIMVLLLLTSIVPMACGHKEVPLSNAIEGRYTIRIVDISSLERAEGRTIAYLDLKDGMYSITPSDDSTPLEELGIYFFGVNPTGTYSITSYNTPFSAETLQSELGEEKNTTLCYIRFDSSRSDSGRTEDWQVLYYDGRIELYFEFWFDYLNLNSITKPWE